MRLLLICTHAILFEISFAFKSTRTSKENGRIVGGVEIDIKDVPYQVSLQFFGFHICGGSIISGTYILTAAHCTEFGREPEYYSVRVGSSFQSTGGEIHYAKGVYVHPFFNKDTFDFDVALLLLNSTIRMDGLIKKIIKMPYFGAPVYSGTEVIVSGWGETLNQNETNEVLRSVRLAVSSHSDCNNLYSDEGGVTMRMICAFVKEKDSCSGDSGGPMVRASDGKLVGIVSFGPEQCAHPILPGVYTQVSFVRFWIRIMARV